MQINAARARLNKQRELDEQLGRGFVRAIQHALASRSADWPGLRRPALRKLALPRPRAQRPRVGGSTLPLRRRASSRTLRSVARKDDVSTLYEVLAGTCPSSADSDRQ